jgi:hypothetical protein
MLRNTLEWRKETDIGEGRPDCTIRHAAARCLFECTAAPSSYQLTIHPPRRLCAPQTTCGCPTTGSSSRRGGCTSSATTTPATRCWWVARLLFWTRGGRSGCFVLVAGRPRATSILTLLCAPPPAQFLRKRLTRIEDHRFGERRRRVGNSSGSSFGRVQHLEALVTATPPLTPPSYPPPLTPTPHPPPHPSPRELHGLHDRPPRVGDPQHEARRRKVELDIRHVRLRHEKQVRNVLGATCLGVRKRIWAVSTGGRHLNQPPTHVRTAPNSSTRCACCSWWPTTTPSG